MILSHAEDQDVALFHLQKLSALHGRAAETIHFIQRDVPPFDRHVAKRRSRTKTTLPAEELAASPLALRTGRPRPHDFIAS